MEGIIIVNIKFYGMKDIKNDFKFFNWIFNVVRGNGLIWLWIIICIVYGCYNGKLRVVGNGFWILILKKKL